MTILHTLSLNITVAILSCFVISCSSSDGGGNVGENDTGSALSSMSDEFDASLSNWGILNSTAATVQVNSGQLVIEPQANILWYQDSAGVLVYQTVSGNFKVSAYVSARRASDDTAVPININLGGLMAHDPISSASIQNYVHVAVGSLNNPIAEHKTTTDAISTFATVTWPSAEAELRICRIGDSFTVLIRPSDANWQSLQVFDRPDLPNTVQVGAMAYSDENGDLRVRFDYVRFESVANSNDCSS